MGIINLHEIIDGIQEDDEDIIIPNTSNNPFDQDDDNNKLPASLLKLKIRLEGSIDNKNGDGKPTSTITTLTANAADITSTTIDTDTNNTIYCLHTDIWACRNCKTKAYKYFANT